MKINKPIPTNIITGFLGSGKTTLIQALLKSKPESEKWAILVNEFGEVGIDGSIFEGNKRDKQVFIREVPGGCMCCTSGLPMQIALNQLISRAQPDRLLIEPTGLGHPKEVLDVFAEPHYQEVIALKSTLTLVDGRKLADARYRDHQGFRQQLEVADIIVASKSDLYEQDTLGTLNHYLQEIGCGEIPVQTSTYGIIDSELLTKPSKFSPQHTHHHHHHHQSEGPDLNRVLQKEGMVSVENEGEGYFSKGWIFSADKVFDYQKITALLHSTDVERFKGVVITNKGIFSFNKAEEVLTAQELDESDDSRFEAIHHHENKWQQLDEQIKSASLTPI